MNLIITRDTLNSIADRASEVVAKKSTAPVLGCVIFDASDDGIEAMSMQVGMGHVGSHKANVSRRGRVAIPVDDLKTAIKSLPVGPISMDLADNGRLTLSVGKSKATIGTLDPADHPGLPTATPTAVVTVAAPDLVRALTQVRASMAEAGNAMGLDGVFVDTTNAGLLRVVTTDGNRLAWSECACTGTPPNKPFIPRAGAVAILSMLDGFAGPVTLSFESARSLVVDIDGERMVLSLAESQFPADYRAVIPTRYKRTVTFDRAGMLDVVNRLVNFKSLAMSLSFAEDSIAFAVKNASGGAVNQGTAEMDATLTGVPMKTGVSCVILKDALTSCSGDVVTLQLDDALTPMSLVNPADTAAQFIIMPMRLE